MARTDVGAVYEFLRKEKGHEPIQLFLSNLYPKQVEVTAIKELQRMDIPCVKFLPSRAVATGADIVCGRVDNHDEETGFTEACLDTSYKNSSIVHITGT